MMHLLARRAGRVGRFLWSGWAGLAGLSLFAALWQAGHEAYGSFILPAPLETLASAAGLLLDSRSWDIAVLTIRRALEGFALTAAIGIASGFVAGYSAAALRMARPILTLLLGVPPIAWIVLAMIWFGANDGTIVATIAIASTPVVFVGAMEGVITRDRGLDDMARVFGAGPLDILLTLSARHVAAHVLPALTIALGSAFKVAVMAELLTNAGGIGSALATARANLDISLAMAWIAVTVAALIVAEYGVLHPIRAELERWRDAARPWGVKR